MLGEGNTKGDPQRRKLFKTLKVLNKLQEIKKLVKKTKKNKQKMSENQNIKTHTGNVK